MGEIISNYKGKNGVKKGMNKNEKICGSPSETALC